MFQFKSFQVFVKHPKSSLCRPKKIPPPQTKGKNYAHKNNGDFQIRGLFIYVHIKRQLIHRSLASICPHLSVLSDLIFAGGMNWMRFAPQFAGYLSPVPRNQCDMLCIMCNLCSMFQHVWNEWSDKMPLVSKQFQLTPSEPASAKNQITRSTPLRLLQVFPCYRWYFLFTLRVTSAWVWFSGCWWFVESRASVASSGPITTRWRFWLQQVRNAVLMKYLDEVTVLLIAHVHTLPSILLMRFHYARGAAVPCFYLP